MKLFNLSIYYIILGSATSWKLEAGSQTWSGSTPQGCRSVYIRRGTEISWEGSPGARTLQLYNVQGSCSRVYRTVVGEGDINASNNIYGFVVKAWFFLRYSLVCNTGIMKMQVCTYPRVIYQNGEVESHGSGLSKHWRDKVMKFSICGDILWNFIFYSPTFMPGFTTLIGCYPCWLHKLHRAFWHIIVRSSSLSMSQKKSCY